ncbi:hypothetical protein NM688_g107 [Phlebia brevispora]|uniref:Uncharacterized protein n=1 Tax=Phlebia brevispora TaxID=194682 RepID=A0ACC1TFN0_9APHY|nr:hypothetical protein NM688_g107 [Phlebia brevispora]
MAAPSREIGTLIVVILKARNLPNKRHIGKQDPYCTVELNGDARRTKAIKRGGQHPEWDEEIRASDSEAPSTLSKGPGDEAPRIQGGRHMKLACYAEYMRDPEFIGEARVDLTEVLTKGETDEWFTLMNKGKYSGEVYLELTFWSNEPPPVKKSSSKPKVKKQYGGPGSFVPSDAPSSSPPTPPSGAATPPRDPYSSISNGLHNMSTGNLHDTSHDSIPSSLRASNSMVRRDLYSAPYETTRSQRSYHSVDSLANDFSELGVQNDQGRSSAYLPPSGSYTYPPPTTSGQLPYASAGHSEPQPSFYEYDGSSSYADPISQDAYDDGRPLTPGQVQDNGILPPAPYQAPYESGGPVQSSHISTRSHGPRYSLPTSSSGFVPIASPAPPVYVAPQFSVSSPYTVDPNLVSTSAPPHQGYGSGYGPPSRTSVPPSAPPQTGLHPSPSVIAASASYQATPPPNAYYQQYASAAYPTNARPYTTPSVPPAQHGQEGSHPLPSPPVHAPPVGSGAQELAGYAYQQTPSPYPQAPPPPPQTLSHSTSSPIHSHISRPLPQPSVRARRHSMITGAPPQIPMNGPRPPALEGYGYANIPPPPPTGSQLGWSQQCTNIVCDWV